MDEGPNSERNADAAPDDPLDLSALYARLRESGQRLTPQRLLILELLHTHGAGGQHVTADDLLVAAQLRYPYLNVSTVYRYLELLREIGLVTETDLGDGRRYFSLLLDERHHHLICLQCGYVEDAEDELFSALRENLLATHGFDARIDHMAVFGVCQVCRIPSAPHG